MGGVSTTQFVEVWTKTIPNGVNDYIVKPIESLDRVVNDESMYDDITDRWQNRPHIPERSQCTEGGTGRDSIVARGECCFNGAKTDAIPHVHETAVEECKRDAVLSSGNMTASTSRFLDSGKLDYYDGPIGQDVATRCKRGHTSFFLKPVCLARPAVLFKPEYSALDLYADSTLFLTVAEGVTFSLHVQRSTDTYQTLRGYTHIFPVGFPQALPLRYFEPLATLPSDGRQFFADWVNVFQRGTVGTSSLDIVERLRDATPAAVLASGQTTSQRRAAESKAAARTALKNAEKAAETAQKASADATTNKIAATGTTQEGEATTVATRAAKELEAADEAVRVAKARVAEADADAVTAPGAFAAEGSNISGVNGLSVRPGYSLVTAAQAGNIWAAAGYADNRYAHATARVIGIPNIGFTAAGSRVMKEGTPRYRGPVDDLRTQNIFASCVVRPSPDPRATTPRRPMAFIVAKVSPDREAMAEVEMPALEEKTRDEELPMGLITSISSNRQHRVLIPLSPGITPGDDFHTAFRLNLDTFTIRTLPGHKPLARTFGYYGITASARKILPNSACTTIVATSLDKAGVICVISLNDSGGGKTAVDHASPFYKPPFGPRPMQLITMGGSYLRADDTRVTVGSSTSPLVGRFALSNGSLSGDGTLISALVVAAGAGQAPIAGSQLSMATNTCHQIATYRVKTSDDSQKDISVVEPTPPVATINLPLDSEWSFFTVAMSHDGTRMAVGLLNKRQMANTRYPSDVIPATEASAAAQAQAQAIQYLNTSISGVRLQGGSSGDSVLTTAAESAANIGMSVPAGAESATAPRNIVPADSARIFGAPGAFSMPSSDSGMYIDSATDTITAIQWRIYVLTSHLTSVASSVNTINSRGYTWVLADWNETNDPGDISQAGMEYALTPLFRKKGLKPNGEPVLEDVLAIRGIFKNPNYGRQWWRYNILDLSQTARRLAVLMTSNSETGNATVYMRTYTPSSSLLTGLLPGGVKPKIADMAVKVEYLSVSAATPESGSADATFNTTEIVSGGDTKFSRVATGVRFLDAAGTRFVIDRVVVGAAAVVGGGTSSLEATTNATIAAISRRLATGVTEAEKQLAAARAAKTVLEANLRASGNMSEKASLRDQIARLDKTISDVTKASSGTEVTVPTVSLYAADVKQTLASIEDLGAGNGGWTDLAARKTSFAPFAIMPATCDRTQNVKEALEVMKITEDASATAVNIKLGNEKAVTDSYGTYASLEFKTSIGITNVYESMEARLNRFACQFVNPEKTVAVFSARAFHGVHLASNTLDGDYGFVDPIRSGPMAAVGAVSVSSIVQTTDEFGELVADDKRTTIDVVV